MAVNPIVSSVDPITFEILSHRIYQISREMGSTLERVGGTVNTTQMHDYMAILCENALVVTLEKQRPILEGQQILIDRGVHCRGREADQDREVCHHEAH